MPFVIDGYNLLHAVGALAGPVGPHQLAKARAGLLGLITAAHASDPVTVVFDARRPPPDVPAEQVHGPVRVEFAVGGEADDRIEWLIAHDPAPKRLVVVSDDRRLQQAARRRGCAAWTCGEYLDWLDRQRPGPPRPPTPEKPAGVGPTEAQRWLAAFGELDREPAWDELFGPFDDGAGI
ncbi:MAG TPA: NYN domain-containing protein [Gemmataceae bacterium]|jgi:predicted RNA-binding protein with PIN domain